MISAVLGTALVLGSSSVLAQDFYVGGGVTGWNFSSDYFSDYSSAGLSLRAGLDISENFAIESHLTIGGDDTNTYFDPFYGTYTDKVELDSLVSLFAKAKLPINENFRLYGLLGVSRIELTVSDSYGYSISDNDTNVAVGLGTEFDVTSNFFIGGDFIRHSLNDSDYDFDTFSVIGAYRF